jgi:hypothetical protein
VTFKDDREAPIVVGHHASLTGAEVTFAYLGIQAA